VIDNSEGHWSDMLPAKLTRGTSCFDTGAFFRLESRSPKDNYWGEVTNFRACSWQDVRKLLYSERMLDDLARYLHVESEPLRLLCREWRPLEKSGEFRCFIRARRLVGISQYHYAGYDDASMTRTAPAFARICADSQAIEQAIRGFMADEVIPHLHVDASGRCVARREEWRIHADRDQSLRAV
jgi:hypothetical protein